MFCVIMLLVAIGVVMVYSASSYFAFINTKIACIFKKDRDYGLLLGIIAMFATINIDYHKGTKDIQKILMLVTTILLLVVFAFLK